MKHLLKLTAGVALVSLAPLMAVQADQVIADDLIVNGGSICAGFGCVNGEAFGFDTIRLKEDNLRIKFQDTSTTQSFPSNDWQITANDSSNGGANKFSIDDITAGRTPFTLTAGAPSHSLFVDSAGFVGLGTSTPVVNLHIKEGNTPTVRLEQDGSAGFAQQTWDLAGNETNFFVRDVTNGSKLPLIISPNSETSALAIDDGGVAIGNVGCTAPSCLPSGLTLYVESTGNTAGLVVRDEGVAVGSQTLPVDTKFYVKDGNAQIDGGNLTVGQSVAGTAAVLNFETAAASWEIKQNGSTGRLLFFSPSGGATGASFKFDTQAQANLFRVGVKAPDTVDINGKLVINNTEINVPDYVFDPDYQLLSIEQQAASMFENRHLPSLPPASQSKDDGVDVVQLQMGVLEELEKAHIYIAQLNDAVTALRTEMSLRTELIDALREQLRLLKEQR